MIVLQQQFSVCQSHDALYLVHGDEIIEINHTVLVQKAAQLWIRAYSVKIRPVKYRYFSYCVIGFVVQQC